MIAFWDISNMWPAAVPRQPYEWQSFLLGWQMKKLSYGSIPILIEDNHMVRVDQEDNFELGGVFVW